MKIISDIFVHQIQQQEKYSHLKINARELDLIFISEWSRYISRHKEHDLLFPVLLERTEEGGLLLRSLEPSMTKLGRCVDKLQVDLLQGPLLGVGQQRLPEGQHPLLRANTAAFDQDEILLDLAVVREATHGVDGLVREIIVSAGVVLDQLQNDWLEIRFCMKERRM